MLGVVFVSATTTVGDKYTPPVTLIDPIVPPVVYPLTVPAFETETNKKQSTRDRAIDLLSIESTPSSDFTQIFF